MIDFEVIEATALITINRPKALNALDVEAYAQLSEAWTRVRDDDRIRAAVITGAGDRAFCAGADIKTFLGREEPIAELWATQRGQLLNRGLEVWKPVVAAVNGICVGGGMTLLMATDIRLAVPSARFGLSEVKRGVIAGNGGTQRALDQLPYPIAMELLLTGDLWDADRALHYGLINRVVEPTELADQALEVAARVARNAPLAVQATKELAVRSRDTDLTVGLRMEQAVNEILRHTEDAAEGIAAFRQKRPPRFAGR
ncbi:MAG: enoyl-CoA hydratase/isomerase family protein [Mycobacterium sp.]